MGNVGEKAMQKSLETAPLLSNSCIMQSLVFGEMELTNLCIFTNSFRDLFELVAEHLHKLRGWFYWKRVS